MVIAVGFFLLGFSPFIIMYLVMENKFKNSTYKKETNSKFLEVLKDSGLKGEYYTAKKLEKLPGYHRLLVNAYIPKAKGGTTEIDVLLIHETGVFVFESKNYGGWIFGDEASKNWTQTFPSGKKQRFYNPIKQNIGHINALKSLLSHISEKHFKSIIVFSERCVLKKVTVDSPEIIVIKRESLEKVLIKEINSSNAVFTSEQIDEIYNQIKPYCNVSATVKYSHIENIGNVK